MDWPYLRCSLIIFHFKLCLLCIGCVHLSNSNEFRVVLNPFKQTDCITKCQNGLLANVDRLVLSGKIYVQAPAPPMGTVASIQLKLEESNDPSNLYIAPLDSCFGHGSHTESFYCEKTDSANVFHVYLNMSADVSLSEKEVVIRVFTDENSQLGNFVKLPKIYNWWNATLTLNGHSLTNGCSGIELEKDTSEITLCCKNIASPCDAIIHHMGVTQVKAKDCVRYTIPEGAIKDFTFTSEACGQPNLAHSYRCQLTPLQTGMDKESGSNDITLKLIVPVSGVVLFIIMCIYWIYKHFFAGKKNNDILYESDRTKFKQY
ncbi:hypothetical protein BgiMline_031221 [Biomphalaria glabrata]|uniref:Uncharacterized protein LOC106078196 isoform X1 n=2 Tax=Biomphalaria glabrata TaxID=6526 RepID=A0A9W2YSB4_BIOGL|nr:uncharacterized protein LOC106078196 isoform X1 [Biomphalaria glabrata]XP_055865594.1 uncharacterized protein LOC106078196 isoform X1 [Biomphalaria glabrata]XP_055865595.1 uncharacterized protein LOC106078196 isoform X1 [Biomphalaria glabrata]XP_055865596.1 uncharacterized protein LOC106078196 isoform X1 [Biomphalaria glabrata]KAI8745751.1 hypothetical protein BgiMline_019467 [Biomphalaria glabrata]